MWHQVLNFYWLLNCPIWRVRLQMFVIGQASDSSIQPFNNWDLEQMPQISRPGMCYQLIFDALSVLRLLNSKFSRQNIFLNRQKT